MKRELTRGRRKRAARIVLAGALLAGALASAAPAAAATTIGSDLAPDPTNSECSSCMITNTALPGAQLTAPSDGVLLRWRVRVESTEVGGNQLRLKVIRDAGGGAFTAISTSATQTVLEPGPPATFEFATQQPVRAGDRIALELIGAAGNLTIATTPQAGVTLERWIPPLADGASGAPTSSFGDSLEILFNADLEPDADCDALGDQTQDAAVRPGCLAQLNATKAKTNGKRLTLDLGCPLVTRDCEGGEVALVTSKPVKLSGAGAAGKAKRIGLGSASFSIAAGGSAAVPVTLTKRARKLFKQRRKVRATATISAAGASSAAQLTITRKKKAKKKA